MKSKIIIPLIKLRKIIAILLTFFKIFQSVKLLLAKYPVKNYSLALSRDLVLRLQKVSNILEKSTRSWSVNNPVAAENKVSRADTTNKAGDEAVEAALYCQKPKSSSVTKTNQKPKVGLRPSEKISSKTKKAASKSSTTRISPDLID